MSLSSISMAGYAFTSVGGAIRGLGGEDVACVEVATEALNILRSFGSDATVYLPGSLGASVSGLLTNNYTDSNGSTGYSSHDGVAGLAKDAMNPASGIHATQSTTANKPAVRRGLYNRATYSHDLTNAGYTVVNLSKAAGTVARTSTVSSAYLSGPIFPVAFAIGEKITTYARVKAKSLGGYFGLRATGSYPARLDALFNLNTGTVVDAFAHAGFTDAVASIAGPDVDGFYIVAVSGTVGGSACVRVLSGPCDSTSSVSGWEAAQATLSDVYIDAQGASNGTFTAQQILAEGGIPLTTSAAASNPDAGRYWWGFDGGDSLALGSVPFQMSDDHVVIAGLTPAFSATDGYAVNPANGASTQMVGCLLVTSSGFAKAAWWDDTSLTAITDNVNRVGTSFVASAVKIGNAKRLRVNSAQSGATENTAKGTTTLTGGSIGSYSPSGSNKYIGSIGPIILIKGTISDAQLLTLERWASSLTPNGPSF